MDESSVERTKKEREWKLLPKQGGEREKRAFILKS